MYAIIRRERMLYNKIYELTDLRMRALSGVMDVLRQAKMGGWEDVLSRDVRGHRDAQMKILREACIVEAVSYSLWDISPALTSVAVFWFAGVIPGAPALTSQVIFPCVAIIETIKIPVSLMPIITAYVMQAAVSMRRLNKFLNEDECPGRMQNEALALQGAVGQVNGGTIGWMDIKRDDDDENESLTEDGPEEEVSLIAGNKQPEYGAIERRENASDGFIPVLRKVRLNLQKGSLIIVLGPVGCGKSKLNISVLYYCGTEFKSQYILILIAMFVTHRQVRCSVHCWER